MKSLLRNENPGWRRLGDRLVQQLAARGAALLA
jgi:hypothetical protein